MSQVRGLSIVIPVFNSEPILAELLGNLAETLPRLTNDFEVILVNDSSRDESWPVIRGAAAHYEWMKGINLMRNYGQHNALLCGIRAASKEIIVTMDDDLQHPPDQIPLLLEEIGHGADVVYGVPFSERHELWRALASRMTKIALRTAMGTRHATDVSAFRAFRTQVREAFAGYAGSFVSIDVLLTWGTSRFASVRVRHEERRAGVSNYSLGRLVRHALNMVTGFSTLPLEVGSVVGLVFMFFGLCVLGYVVGRYFLQGNPVPGFPFLASALAIFSGVQLFTLGIIGEYLARVHFRTMDRPQYVVRETVDEAGIEHG